MNNKVKDWQDIIKIVFWALYFHNNCKLAMFFSITENFLTFMKSLYEKIFLLKSGIHRYKVETLDMQNT